MTLQTLNYIRVIAKYKSFSKAAKSLYMSQSTLSAAVKDLEKELGIQIFIRNNRGVELTLEGEDFLIYATDILDRSNLLALKYKNQASSHTNFSVSTQHLPFALRAFNDLMESLPESYDTAIRETTTNNVIYDVSTGKSELGILAISSANMDLIQKALQKYNLVFEEITKLNIYVFLRRNHPLASHATLSIGDLQSYAFVTYDQNEAPSYYTEELLLQHRFAKNIRVTDRASKMLLIRNTDAFSLGVDLPNYNADIYFTNKDTELAAVPLEDNVSEIITGFIHLQNYSASDLSDTYIRYLKEQVSKLKLPNR